MTPSVVGDETGHDPVVAGSEPVRTDVGMLHMPAGDTVMLSWMRVYGTYEVAETAIIDELLGTGGTFVDIGAHVGYYTLRALRLVGPHGAVVAVEPWDRVRELLVRNVRDNLGQPGMAALTLVADAAWDVEAALVMRPAYEVNSGDSRVYSAGGCADVGGGLAIRGVRVGELTVLAERRVDVVKVDTQGADHRALAGMAEVLCRDHPTVLCEYCPALIREIGDDPEEVLALYRAWGYHIEPVRNPAPGHRWSNAELADFVASAADSFVMLRLRPIGQDECADATDHG